MLGRLKQACPTPNWEEGPCELASVGKDIPKCLLKYVLYNGNSILLNIHTEQCTDE